MGNSELEPNRRGFLKLAGLGLVTLAAGGLVANYEWQKRERLKKINGWEPGVVNLLNETIESSERDNLKTLNDLNREQFVDLVDREQEAVFSSDHETRDRSRYNLFAFVVGRHYARKHYSYDSGVIYNKDSLNFLDNVVEGVGSKNIQESDTEAQANWWAEAVFRSYAAGQESDPTFSDGVWIQDKESQSLLGNALGRGLQFVPLQPHTQSSE